MVLVFVLLLLLLLNCVEYRIFDPTLLLKSIINAQPKALLLLFQIMFSNKAPLPLKKLSVKCSTLSFDVHKSYQPI